MNMQINDKSAKTTRHWARPQFARLGGLSQVANTCSPSHLPGGPFCTPS
jgi:hypothetical protein